MVAPLCPNCETALKLRFDGVVDVDRQQPFSILECPQCGLGVTDPVPDDLGAFYLHQYHGGRHGITARLCDRRRLRWVNAFQAMNSSGVDHRDSPPGSVRDRKPRLLDVGCGEGTFLRQASKAGWQVVGVEQYPELARQLELTVVETIEQAEPWGPFDCVTMWHSLEHMANPDHTIATISRLLADQGKILVAVPNFGSLQATCFGRHWLHLDVPRHLFHFTRDAIDKLGINRQLSTVMLRTSEWEYDWMGWIQSGLNALRLRPNLLLKMMMGRSTQASLAVRCVHFSLGVIWGSFTFLPTVIGCWLGRGGTLVVCLGHNNASSTDDPSNTPLKSMPGHPHVS